MNQQESWIITSNQLIMFPYYIVIRDHIYNKGCQHATNLLPSGEFRMAVPLLIERI